MAARTVDVEPGPRAALEPPAPLGPSAERAVGLQAQRDRVVDLGGDGAPVIDQLPVAHQLGAAQPARPAVEVAARSEEHTSELQSRFDLVCRLLLEKKNT